MAANNKLSDVKRKEFDDYYKTKRETLPVCSTCKTNNDVIPSVRGKPSMELLQYAEEGNVKLSGCTQGYKGWCKKCEQFL